MQASTQRIGYEKRPTKVKHLVRVHEGANGRGVHGATELVVTGGLLP